MVTVNFFPRPESARYRAVSRACAYCNFPNGCWNPLDVVFDTPLRGTYRYDQALSTNARLTRPFFGFGNPEPAHASASRALSRHEAQVAHELAWITRRAADGGCWIGKHDPTDDKLTGWMADGGELLDVGAAH